MGYAIGKAPTKTGEVATPETMPVYTGTSPEDFQRWLWSLYRSDNAALARGGTVSGTGSMNYKVDPAVVIVPTGTGRAIAVPVDATTVTTPAAPSTGTRTDYIVVGQDGAVKVASSHTAGTALLDRRTVPAGITATTATSSQLGDRKYAPLFGGTMGRMFSWWDSAGFRSSIPAARTQLMATTITVDSDRLADFRLLSTLALDAQTAAWSSVGYEIYIDSVRNRSIEFKVEPVAESKEFSFTRGLTAGTHTVQLFRSVKVDSKHAIMHYGGGSDNWPGTTLEIVDLGAVA